MKSKTNRIVLVCFFVLLIGALVIFAKDYLLPGQENGTSAVATLESNAESRSVLSESGVEPGESTSQSSLQNSSESKENSQSSEEYNTDPVCKNMGEQLVIKSYPSPIRGKEAPDYSKTYDVWQGELGVKINKATLYRNAEAVPANDELKGILAQEDFNRRYYIELEVEFENISAKVLSGEDEYGFDMSILSMTTLPEFISQKAERLIYTASYYKESTKENHEYLVFRLPQGETLSATLGYFVSQSRAEGEKMVVEVGHLAINKNAIVLNELKEG